MAEQMRIKNKYTCCNKHLIIELRFVILMTEKGEQTRLYFF